eukprot:TRINITY_DN29096_c0_g3_i1.p1 TRINITY_DN29096_c0_g3~~TRINITY_DN29096_c0_g3_i1.p1  ORF type:complete len:383 (-),score=36.87 TRINITY_DN29096_c0_g3_i1:112-1260(-)
MGHGGRKLLTVFAGIVAANFANCAALFVTESDGRQRNEWLSLLHRKSASEFRQTERQVGHFSLRIRTYHHAKSNSTGQRADLYTVAMVFSGRKDREFILCNYLDALLRSHKLDEVHLWALNSPKESDQTWLHERATDSGYLMAAAVGWLPPYQFYGTNGGFKPKKDVQIESTVILKIDDDIVFIDLEGFQAYVDYVRSHPNAFLVHANIVNNHVAAYYQAQRVPELAEIMPELLVYPSAHQDFLWSNGLAAIGMHNLFVKQPRLFSWRDDGGECLIFEDPNSRDGQGRFSINFFAYLRTAADKVIKLVEQFPNDDEHALTTVATDSNNNLQECMFSAFTVSHLAYYPQSEASTVLPLYEELWNACQRQLDEGRDSCPDAAIS